MSGSRGEANFVFRCKNCKVRMDSSVAVPVHTEAFSAHHSVDSASLRQPSRRHPRRTSRLSRPRRRTFLSLTAVVLSSQTSGRRCVFRDTLYSAVRLTLPRGSGWPRGLSLAQSLRKLI